MLAVVASAVEDAVAPSAFNQGRWLIKLGVEMAGGAEQPAVVPIVEVSAQAIITESGLTLQQAQI
jgi:hypothetical protein